MKCKVHLNSSILYRMKNMNKLNTLFTAGILASGLLFTACDNDSETSGQGTAQVFITDAPVDDANITAAVITVTNIEIKGQDGWKTLESFNDPVQINLLDYQNGDRFSLGETSISAGTYSELRLELDAVAEGAATQNPGCYLEYADGSRVPLFVPSGSQTGYKIMGDFIVNAEGQTNVTIDFDVRKSIVTTGQSGKTILKPAIRFVSDNNAGSIEGDLNEGSNEEQQLIAYAYHANTYVDTEVNKVDDESPRFPNAVSSTRVNAQGKFILPYLHSGEYEIIVASHNTANGEFNAVIKTQSDVMVKAGQSISLNITVDLSLGL